MKFRCPMPEGFVRKWINALRSGDYTQRVGRLKKGGQYCVLGVACDVSDKGQWVGSDKEEWLRDGSLYPSRVRMTLGEHRGDYNYIPISIIREYSEDIADELVERNNNQLPDVGFTAGDDSVTLKAVSIADLNDLLVLSFDEMADILEFYLKPHELEVV